MRKIRTIVLADKEHPNEQVWSWRSTRVTQGDRFIGRGLISRDDLATLSVGDRARVVKAAPGWMLVRGTEEVIIGEARVGSLNNGNSNAGGQPWALFEALDPGTIMARNEAAELEHADWEARMHWVPSPPPPRPPKPVREVTAKVNPHCTRNGILAFFEGDTQVNKGDVVMVNGETKLKVQGAFPRVPDGSCTFWGVPA